MGSYESESKLEDRMIDQFRRQGYQYIEINDVTELERNFREQINLHNRAELKFKDLSDKEFERLMVKISGKGVFQSAKELRQKQDIQRDDGSIVYIELFNTKDWCKIPPWPGGRAVPDPGCCPRRGSPGPAWQCGIPRRTP